MTILLNFFLAILASFIGALAAIYVTIAVIVPDREEDDEPFMP